MTLDMQIVEPSSLRLRDRVLQLVRHDPPMKDGEIFGLEANADDYPHARNHLKPHELRGIAGRELPAGLSICIERAKTHLNNSSLVYFENLNDGPTLKAWIHFDYASWHLPMHLAEFAEVLQAELMSSRPWMRRIEVDESEGSVNLLCVATIEPPADCYETFQHLDDAILKSYRAALRRYFSERPSREAKGTAAPIPDTHGTKWWVRYVVVPVVVGLVAVAALLLRN